MRKQGSSYNFINMHAYVDGQKVEENEFLGAEQLLCLFAQLLRHHDLYQAIDFPLSSVATYHVYGVYACYEE
ncbi:MAG: hypothetical protein E3J73_06335 [Candidatus Bathyarchaeum sp.]|nr:MAG: hypothetical protein E3J73_06335 [Candidatus Bathyarchaeum sp.]